MWTEFQIDDLEKWKAIRDEYDAAFLHKPEAVILRKRCRMTDERSLFNPPKAISDSMEMEFPFLETRKVGRAEKIKQEEN